MKSQSLFQFIFYSVVSILACGSPDHIWNEDSNRVAREVRNTLNRYYQDINQEGILAEFKYLDSSALFSWQPPGYDSAVSFKEIKPVLLRNASLYPHVQLSWDSLVIEPLAAGKAKYTGKLTSIVRDTAGKITTNHFSEEGLLMKKEDGWKLVSGKTEAIVKK